MTVSLKWLLDGIAAVPESDAQIVDLAIDSRDVRRGSLFLALRGTKSHGLEHAVDAAARGASAVLWEPAAGIEPPSFEGRLFAAPVPNLRRLAGRIADRFFQWPSSQMRIVGVTGTNGKTTCAYLITQCLERLGRPAAYMGTLGWGFLGRLETPTHTTPDAVSVHRSFARLKSLGVREVAMEVSSHALDQGRVEGVRFHSAAFTNLSRDHLDYHVSMQAYAEAKARLFSGQDLEQAIINVGDPFGRELAHKLMGGAPLTAVWIGSRADAWLAERFLEAREVRLDLHGISLDIEGSSGEITLSTKLLGRFNAENVLVVLGCLLALGVPLAEAAAALGACSAPPGRMEVVEAPAPGKPLALWCVFGCGGDRDAGKRPIMGSIADELADQIIVTDDNPRSEDPQEIIRAITRGIRTQRARVIPDRAAAIASALNRAGAADIVLIAGKGHEDYQIYGATRRSFSDRTEAQKILGAAA
jgi:UDP-N-acetylmuramoyl-L-alanyl-D-glutamate--2,6-diaminopimelate ligase